MNCYISEELEPEAIKPTLRRALQRYPALRPIFYWNYGMERSGLSIFAIAGATGRSLREVRDQLQRFHATKLGRRNLDRFLCSTTALTVYALPLKWDSPDFSEAARIPAWRAKDLNHESRLLAACPRRPSNEFLRKYSCPEHLIPKELKDPDDDWFEIEGTAIDEETWKEMCKFSRNFPCTMKVVG